MTIPFKVDFSNFGWMHNLFAGLLLDKRNFCPLPSFKLTEFSGNSLTFGKTGILFWSGTGDVGGDSFWGGEIGGVSIANWNVKCNLNTAWIFKFGMITRNKKSVLINKFHNPITSQEIAHTFVLLWTVCKSSLWYSDPLDDSDWLGLGEGGSLQGMNSGLQGSSLTSLMITSSLTAQEKEKVLYKKKNESFQVLSQKKRGETNHR